MAAEPIGSAYVIIRAITSQLSKDIKDGLDKGASDADTDDAGRTLGRSVGESAGDEFGDTWNERSSEAIEDSANSRDMRRATDRFGDSINERLRESFDSDSFGDGMQQSIRRGFDDIDVDEATGTFGDDAGRQVVTDMDTAVDDESRRRGLFNFDNQENRDRMSTGMSGVMLAGTQGASEGAARVGTSAAGSFGDSFIKTMSSLTVPGGSFAVIGTQLALPFLGAGLQVIGALGGVVVSTLGFITTAAAGGLIAILGLGAALAPAFLGIKAAFGAPSDALDDLTEDFEQFKEDWQVFGRAVQTGGVGGGLFPALHQAIAALSTPEFMDIFVDYGALLGDALGLGVTSVVDQITAPGNQDRIRNILEGSIPIIENLGEALGFLVTPILQIIEAAMPIALDFSEVIRDAAEKFSLFIGEKAESGALTTTFETWWERLKQIGRILWDLAGALWNILSIGGDAATPFFDSLEDAAASFKEWTESATGENKIKTFFDNAWLIANQVFGLIGDIIKLLADPLFGGGADTVLGGGTAAVGITGIPEELIEPTQAENIANFFKQIREEWLPLLVEWGDVAQKALEGPVGDFFEALADFIRTLADNPEIVAGIFSILMTNFFIFSEAIELLSKLLKTDIAKEWGPLILKMVFFMKVAATFMKFGKKLLKFFKELWKVAKLLGTGLLKLGKGLLFLGRALFSLVFANPVTLIITAIIAAVVLLYFHFKPFREFVDKYIIDPIQRLWEKIGGFQGIIDFFQRVGEAVVRFFTGIKNAFQAGGIGGVFDFLVEQLGNLGGLILEGLANALPALGNAIIAIGQFLWDHKDEIAEWGLNILQWIGEKLLDLGGFLLDMIVAGGEWLWNNKWRIAQWGLDILEWIGEKLVDVGIWLAGLLASFGIWLWDHKDEFGQIGLDILGWIGEKLIDVGVWLAGLVASFGIWLWDHKGDIGQFGLDILQWIGEKLVDVGVWLAGLVAAFGVWLWDHKGDIGQFGLNILKWIGEKLVDIGVWLAGLVAAFGIWLWDHKGDIAQFGLDILKWIGESLVDVGIWLAGMVASFGIWLAEHVDDIGQLGLDILGWIGEKLVDVGDMLWDFIWAIGDWIVQEGPTAIKNLGGDILGLIGEGLSNLDNIGSMLLNPVNAVISWIRTDGLDAIKRIGAAIGGLIWDGIREVPVAIGGWLTGGLIGGGDESDFQAIFDEFFYAFDHGLATRDDSEEVATLSDYLQTVFKESMGVDLPEAEATALALRLIDDISGGVIENGAGVETAINDVLTTSFGAADTTTAATSAADTAVTDYITAWDNAWKTSTPPTDGFTSFSEKVGPSQKPAITQLAEGWRSETQAALDKLSFELPAPKFGRTGRREDRQGGPGAVPEPADSTFALGGVPTVDAATIATFVESFATQISDALDKQNLAAPLNKLVDAMLLTLSRLGNEANREVINPFILQMVAGINKASALSVKAMNKLVNAVLLTLSRISNETKRTLDPFVLRAVEVVNRASTEMVAATNRLVNAVLLTMARIPNEVGRVLTPVIAAASAVMRAAGVAAAASLESGFQGRLGGFLAYLRGIDSQFSGAIGDLSGTLYSKGVQLIEGLIRGANDRIARLSISAVSFMSFARGGVVPGTGPQMAIVHGGEVIMNMKQQKAVFGGAVGRWSEEGAWMLRLAGQSWTWLGDLLNQMSHESGGNPGVVNRWDINWILGHPSMGLMQTIQSTFNAYAGELIGRGILDPLANIFAAIKYTLARYGSLGYWRRNGFKGYGEGGIFDSPTLGVFGEAGREALIPLNNPTRAMELMRMAGLDAMVMADAAKNISNTDTQSPLGPNVTDVAMLRIDHAEIFDKVDVDIIGARIRRAYKSMAGR